MSFSTGPDTPGGGQALRLTRLRHFGELIWNLTYNLDTEASPHSTWEVVDPTKDGTRM